jgi:hypothetical protein
MDCPVVPPVDTSNSRPVVTPISPLIDLLDIRDLHDTVDLVWSQMRSPVLRRLRAT